MPKMVSCTKCGNTFTTSKYSNTTTCGQCQKKQLKIKRTKRRSISDDVNSRYQ